MKSDVGPPSCAKHGRALTGATNRQGVRSQKAPAVVVHDGVPKHPSVCDGCGAVYAGKKWHRGLTLASAELARAAWTRCPACGLVEAGEYHRRLLLRGPTLAGLEREVRRRVRNVEACLTSRLRGAQV